MSGLVKPAPLWRRLAAAVYDGLLLLALWMVAALLDVMIRDALGVVRDRGLLQGILFLIGFGFLGWSWTHGGQTLGMRSWKLQVRRDDGSELRWPVAAARYCVLLLTWLAALLPALLRIPKLAAHAQAGNATVAAVAITIVALLALLLDPRRRALCDWAAGTEVVELPGKT